MLTEKLLPKLLGNLNQEEYESNWKEILVKAKIGTIITSQDMHDVIAVTQNQV